MENVTFITVDNPDGTTTEHAIIDHGNGEFTSMPKAIYDEQQAAQATLVTESAPTAQQGVALLIQPPLGVRFSLPRRG